MNESTRTLTFVGAAGLIALVAWATRPAPSPPASASAGEIVSAFDVSEANTFKIERYDPDEQELVTFEVTKDGGRWVIPSHGGYPADAQSQLQKVAGFFTGMTAIGSLQSNKPAQHGDFGVKQPTAETTGDGKEYGSVVTIADDDGKELVSLIVGKSAKADASDDDELAGKPLRFVRNVKSDDVFVVEISLDAITTKFEDWIEQDLLKLNAFDVAKLELHDYSLIPVQDDEGIALRLMRRMDTQVKWNSERSSWDLVQMTRYDQNKPLEGELAPDEELDKTKLDGVKTAVDDLKIVDVERKPPVLFQALKDEKLARDSRARAELQRFGFFVTTEPGSKKLKYFATNGGLNVSMKDGVQYQLYFGDPKSAEKGDSTKLNRYLMVTAQLDESMLPKPVLEPEDEPLGPAPTDKPADEDPQPEDRDDTSEKADEAALKGEEPDDKAAEEVKLDDEPLSEDEQKAAADAEKKRRETVKKENKRKMDEYNDKRKKAEARVAELNARFNDWFYVVSDDVYKKVQLGRADLVKDRPTAREEGFGVDAFRQLEQGGVEGKAEPMTTAPPPPPSGFPGGFPM